MDHTDMLDIFSLKGKTAIVVGATGGLGSAMALALAYAGADLISVQHPNEPDDTVHKAREAGRSAIVYKCDLMVTKDIRSTIDRIWADGHTPDILFYAAGINRRGPALDLMDDDIDSVFQINLKANYVFIQEVGRQMISQKRQGKIISIGSLISFVGNVNAAPYAATKGAVLQMTKAFSNEWAGNNIQVNCICPGYIKTPLTKVKWSDKEHHDSVVRRIPAGRWGEPRDFKGVVMFLASSASDYVTGTSIVVDGGYLAR